MLAVLGVFLYAIVEVYSNRRAFDVRGRINQAFAIGLKEGYIPPLRAVGGIEWDYICSGSYEARGIDVASTRWIAEHAFIRHIDDKLQDLSGFDIADQTYTEFSGSEYGLVYVSVKEKLVVGTLFPDSVLLKSLGCVSAKDASLNEIINTGHDKNNGYRTFVLSGTKMRK